MNGLVDNFRKGVQSAGMPAASSDWRTWLLAVAFVALFDVAITRTRVLWGPTAFEHTRDLSRQQFGQIYQATRALYAPVPAARRVLVLGNSRAYLGIRPRLLESALAARGSDATAHVDNIAIFGAGLGDQEVLSRHLADDDAATVVLTLDATDLLDTAALPLAGAPSRLLDVGFRDGPLPSPDGASRVARWARTVWPLFRFHEFARAAIVDRVTSETPGAPFPDHFADLHAVFAYRHGPRTPLVEKAYAQWRTDRTLASFVSYLEQGNPEHLQLVRTRTRQMVAPGPDAPGVRVLRSLLDRLAARGRPLIVLMPENPLLVEDAASEFHRRGLSDRVAGLVETEAKTRGIPVADLRRSLGADGFLDFDHPLPELAGFDDLVAQEIVRAHGA